jgi:transcriptional regulator with XRE-family HTH domain
MPLKEILKSRGLKQVWLADRMGVSEVTISNWVSAKSIPSKRNLNKLSEILDVPVELINNSGKNRIDNE